MFFHAPCGPCGLWVLRRRHFDRLNRRPPFGRLREGLGEDIRYLIHREAVVDFNLLLGDPFADPLEAHTVCAPHVFQGRAITAFHHGYSRLIIFLEDQFDWPPENLFKDNEGREALRSHS